MPTSPNPQQTDTPPDQSQDDQAHYRRVLQELVAIGMDVARHLHRQITAPVAAHPSPPEAAVAQATGDLTLALDRTARMVRRSILLAQHLNQAPAAQAHEQAQEASRARHQVAARKRIIREIEDTIQRQPSAERAESAHQELLERLEAPDLEDEIEDRPIGDIIKDLCRDLGLADVPGAPQWTRRTAADIERLCARAATPRRPPARPNPSAAPLRSGTPPPANHRPWPPEPRRKSV